MSFGLNWPTGPDIEDVLPPEMLTPPDFGIYDD